MNFPIACNRQCFPAHKNIQEKNPRMFTIIIIIVLKFLANAVDIKLKPNKSSFTYDINITLEN